MPNNKTAVREYLQQYLIHFKRGLSPEYLERYAAFLASLEKLVALTDYLYQHNDRGDYYAMTADDYTRTLAAYQDAIAQCDRFIQAEYPADGNGKRNVPASVQNMRTILTGDLNFFSAFTPNGEITFPDAIAQARGYTLDLTDVENPTSYGDSMSTRVAVRFTDPNGKTVEGFFTSETRLNLVHDYRKIINDFLDQNKDAAGTIGALLDPENEKRILEPLIKGAADMSSPAIHWISGEPHYYGDLLPQNLSEELKKDAYRPLMKQLDSFVSGAKLLIDRIGIADDSPISARNNAMTAVANLLGISEVLAKSSPMKMKIKENGVVKTVSGTFMERAQGTDMVRLGDLYGPMRRKLHDAHDFQFTPEALESMAKLQILDFVCHNVDRHMNNMTYDMADGNPPIVRGVQGFDNDLSFGRRNTSADGSTNWAPTLDQLAVIPASLAEALAHVDIHMLVTALRGCGLSHSEIALTVERIDLLNRKIAESVEPAKEMAPGEVKNGVLRVVEKDGWKHYKNDELAKLHTENTRNIFEVARLTTKLAGARQYDFSIYENAVHVNDPIAAFFDKLSQKTVSAGSGLPNTIVDKACELILSADALTGFGSDNFKKVRDAVLDLRRMTQSVWTDQNGKPLYTRDFCEQFRQSLDRVRTASSVYLVNKTRRTGWVAERRIRAVSLIAEWAEKQYTALHKATAEQAEMDTRTTEKEAYLQQVQRDVQAEMDAYGNEKEGEPIRPVLQRVQTQIRNVQASVPEGSQRQLLCTRALEAQEMLYTMAETAGKNLTKAEDDKAHECMATLVAYDMAFRANVFANPAYDETKFRADELIQSVLQNEVFVADTKGLNKDQLKLFVDHNLQRRLDQKMIAVSGNPHATAPKQSAVQRPAPEREVDGFVIL